MARRKVKKVEIDDLISTHYFAPDYQTPKPEIQEVKRKSQEKINSATKYSTTKKTNSAIKYKTTKNSYVIKRNYPKRTAVIRHNPKNKTNLSIKRSPPKKSDVIKRKTPKKFNPSKKITRVNKPESPILDDKRKFVTSIENSASCSNHLSSLTEKFYNSLTNDISIPHFEGHSLNVSSSFNEELPEMNEEVIWEQLSILQTLHKKEIELKTTLLYEKLKKEEVVVADEILLKEKITQLKDEVNKRKIDLKLKETMCSEGQLLDTLRQIALPRFLKKGAVVKETHDFSEGERGLILGHLLRKEQLKKELSSEQKKIAEMEENCRKMKLAIEKNGEDSICGKLNAMNSGELDAINSDDWKELESLKNENLKRGARIQLFAKLFQYLIQNIKSVHSLNDDLKILSSACEQIQHWNYEDVDELEELYKKVCATKI